MNVKKILSLVLITALAAGMNCTTSMAAPKKKITIVNLTVKASVLPGGSISQQEAEVTARSSKIDVGDCKFINDGFQWGEKDVPRLEVKLYADDDYYFRTEDTGFTIQGGTYVSQKKEDFKQTLTVTIDLPRVDEFTQSVESAKWSSLTGANWNPAIGAGSYEVKLYRNGKKLGSIKTTADTHYDFCESMTRSGNYTFRVRPVNRQKPEQKGSWVESSSKQIDEAAASQISRAARSTKSGWKQDQIGWWYINSDGSYPVNDWQNINGNWYFFNEKGYMATGWITWKGKQYYCNEKSGQMMP